MTKTLKEIEKTEWFPSFIIELENIYPDFVKKMKNRMIMSFFKYGFVKKSYEPEGKIDTLESAMERLELYKKLKNTEYLIDAANFFGIEFKYPNWNKKTEEIEVFTEGNDNIVGINECIKSYKNTGDKQYLKNAANYCALEYIHPSYNDSIFKATDTEFSPGRITKGGEREYEGKRVRNLLPPRRRS